MREGVSTNKREAEKVLMQRLTVINENKHPILRKRKNKKIKFVEFSEKYIKEHAKPTKKSYKCDMSRLRNLIPYFGDLYLHEMGNGKEEEWGQAKDSMEKRWLDKYEASKNWDSQLDASLITFKTTSLHKFHEVIRLMNTFFVNKEILPDVQPGENRAKRIKLT